MCVQPPPTLVPLPPGSQPLSLSKLNIKNPITPRQHAAITTAVELPPDLL